MEGAKSQQVGNGTSPGQVRKPRENAMSRTRYCVCSTTRGHFIKSGDDEADVLRRAGEGAQIVSSHSCPALAVQAFYITQGDEYRTAEEPVQSMMRAVGWACAPDCQCQRTQ